MKIGFIGNFSVPFSTENERKWSFERLGHMVIRFQENTTVALDLLNPFVMQQLDMLVYSHTHDPAYEIAGLINVFEKYKQAGIPTVSCHLDRWAWLNREKDMGKEATWFTEYIFMADASPEAVKLYSATNLNWYQLKPGVVERDCYMAQSDKDKFPHEIIFVGSKGYHPEYPFRRWLVDFLHKTYGNRFGHYGNDGIRVVRQDELNVLYASAKIVVGDSCFAGQTSNYWSDRIPETTGRGGFLIHPSMEGIDHKGVVWYEAGNLDDLKACIDYHLEHAERREKIRIEGFEWTKNNRTYTHLAQEMINIVCKQSQ